MAPFLDHWWWNLTIILVLSFGLLYTHLVRKARAYTSRVKKELEEYVKQPVSIPAPLPIPLRHPSDYATLSDEKQAIWQEIHSHPLSHYEQVAVLVHQLAEARIAARFQDTYFTIFGSQHAFLRRLNAQTGTGLMSRIAAHAFLKEIEAANPLIARANHDFNQWLSFLVSRGFVNVGLDSISITNGGQDFLVWVMRRQLPERTYEGV